MQSSGETASVNFVATPLPPLMSSTLACAGRPAASSSVIANGRIVACGHTYEHWLHWMQLSGSHFGTSTATPRFS